MTSVLETPQSCPLTAIYHDDKVTSIVYFFTVDAVYHHFLLNRSFVVLFAYFYMKYILNVKRLKRIMKRKEKNRKQLC